MFRRLTSRASLAVALLLLTAPRAQATPSTVFWAPSTPAVQPFGVMHITYDTYFNSSSAYPTDAGLTFGVLPGKSVQAELGFDVLYPTYSGSEPVNAPFVINAKLGAPEDVYFKGQPAWSAGIYEAGFEKDVNDQNVIYATIGKTLPRVGAASIGGYYGLNENLFHSAGGQVERSGVLAGWMSPTMGAGRLGKLNFAWDLQTGKNVLGATGGGAYLYVTPAVDLLTGPVFFFEKDLQPGGSSWMWTIQLDVDFDLLAGNKK